MLNTTTRAAAESLPSERIAARARVRVSRFWRLSLAAVTLAAVVVTTGNVAAVHVAQPADILPCAVVLAQDANFTGVCGVYGSDDLAQ